MRPFVSVFETMDCPSTNGYSMPVTGRLVRKRNSLISGGIVDLRQFYEIPVDVLLDADQKRTKRSAPMKKTDVRPDR
jgi:hypothetical protein